MPPTMNTLDRMKSLEAKTLEQQLAAANAPEPKPAEPAAPKPRAAAKAPKAPRRSASQQRQSEQRAQEGKVHIGAWLHKDFKRSLMLLRAETGEDVQTVLARVLNAEFRAHKIPVVKT